MCLGIPGKLVEFSPDHPDLGRVDVQGVVRDINLALLDDDPVRPGEWVLIHLGFALQKMTEAEVQEALSVMADLGEGSCDDRDPMAEFQFDPDEIHAATMADEPHYGERPS
jgi:hydrogenase expression/formation protein HypC